MAFRKDGGKEGNEGDKHIEELKQKARDGVYDLDTDSLVVQTKRSYEAAKILKKEQKNIKRKRDQETSKKLSKCMDKYDESFKVITEAASIVNPTLEREPGSRKVRKTTSLRETRNYDGQRRTEQHRMIESSKAERQTTERNERRKLDDDDGSAGTNVFDRFDYSPRTQMTNREATQDLERRIKSLEGEKVALQQKMQEERLAKDDYLRRLEQIQDTHVTIDAFNNLKQEKDSLNQALMQMTDNVKRKQVENQEEIYKLKLKCKSLEEAKETAIKSYKKEIDKIQNEREDQSRQYEVEKNAKSDALTSLDKMSKTSVSVDSFETIQRKNDSLNAELQRLQQESSDKISAQNNTIQRLHQDIERLRHERENYLQQCNTEKETMNQTVSSLHRDVERLKQERGHYKKQCNVETEEKYRLKQNLDGILHERDELIAQCKAEQEEKADALKRIDQLMKNHFPKESFDELERQVIALKTENERLHSQFRHEWTSKQETLNRLQQDKDMITCERDKDRQKYDNERVAYETSISRLQQDIERLCQEREYNRQQYEAETEAKNIGIRRLEQEKRHVTQERDNARQLYKAEKEAKDDAVNRLSLIASSRLRDNNPNITDLSDQNRPTKIAEKLSELYDNQWTDAFDALENHNKNEREILDILLESLMTAYKECSKLANDNYLETVQRSIECREQGPKSSPYEIVMSDQLKQEIKEFRKKQASTVWKDIKEIVLPKIQLSGYHLEETDSYISFCIEITWLMAVQDPPLVLNKDTQVNFDTNRFKDYTKRGKFVEYVVWPALLLYESGPLLSKGVAQGCNTPLFTQSVGRFPRKDGDEKDQRKQMASTFSGGVATGTR